MYYLGALPFFLLNILIRSSPACSRKKSVQTGSLLQKEKLPAMGSSKAHCSRSDL